MCLILIDTDAFLSARRLGLLELLRAAPAAWPKPSLYCTGIIARIELNDLQLLIGELEALDLLRVERVMARSPAAQLKREIKAKLHIDRGEAEAIAWAVHAGRPVAFVSHDLEAQRAARKSQILGWDLFDLGKHWLEAGLLSKDQFRSVFEPWEEGPRVFGRPSAFEGIDETFQRRFGSSLVEFVCTQTKGSGQA